MYQVDVNYFRTKTEEFLEETKLTRMALEGVCKELKKLNKERV
jgi:hypothetical protein